MGFLLNSCTVAPSNNCCYCAAFGGTLILGEAAAPFFSYSGFAGTFIGGFAGGASMTGGAHVLIGYAAGYCMTTGNNNTVIGNLAGYMNTTGSDNVAIGSCAMYGCAAGVRNPCCNTAIGYQALMCVTTGYANTAIGFLAGAQTSSGFFNTSIGMRAGCCIISGSCNIMIGYNVYGSGLAGGSGCICISTCGAPPAFLTVNSTGLGICTSAPAAKLHVTGCLLASSEITAYYSDRRLKENIVPIDNALEKISKINGVTYTPNKKAIGFGFEENKKHIGVIADEVESVLPEVIYPAPFDTSTGRESVSGEFYKTVKYERIVPLLIEGIKDLKQQADDLRTRLHDIKKQIRI